MVPTLDSTSSLESLYDALMFTLVRLRLDPRLHVFIPTYEALIEKWWIVFKEERAILDERMAGEAAVDQADADLSATSDAVASLVLLATRNNRKATLFIRYFGSQKPSRFRRPVLKGKLKAMRDWPPSLQGSANPALKSRGDLLVDQIKAADAAVALVLSSDQKLEDLGFVGAKKRLFSEANGARKQLHGDVSRLIHDNPAWGFPAGYADALFQHKSAPSEPSIGDLEKKIESAEAEVARLQALRKQRIDAEGADAAERAAAERKAKQAVLAAAKKAAAEAAERLAALEAELDDDDDD